MRMRYRPPRPRGSKGPQVGRTEGPGRVFRLPDARLAALTAIEDIMHGDMLPKEALDLSSSGLDRRDRAFAMELAYGVIRYRDTIDWILGHFLEKPRRLGSFTMNNLRMAAYQIYFMRVPERAAVHESVELEKRDHESGRPSLVNAVLRNLLRQRSGFQLPIATDDPIETLRLNTSHPRWMVERWAGRFGLEEASRLAEANNRIPGLTLRTNTLRTSREELITAMKGRGIGAEPTEGSPDGIVPEEGTSFSDLSFAPGLFAVQDEAAQLISYLLGPQPGERVLDACAAPGGKTTHMAQLMRDEGEIIAVEKDPLRAEMITENTAALGLRSVKTIAADLMELGDIGMFDRILLDPPCSATGVIRRNPDVKYRHTPKDLEGFGLRQRELLKTASARLKPGGTLTYSVCSVEPEEGEMVIEDFLKGDEEFRIIESVADCLDRFISGGIFRTYPHRHGMDGFFGVSLCRKR